LAEIVNNLKYFFNKNLNSFAEFAGSIFKKVIYIFNIFLSFSNLIPSQMKKFKRFYQFIVKDLKYKS
jgi:hypothetical protein